MSYLEQYDSLPSDQIQQKVGLVSQWIRPPHWPAFFKELRENRPVFATPAFTLITHYPDVHEVLSLPRVFSVRLYAPKMDPVVNGPFMLARDETEVNWREKSIMRAMLRPEDLPRVREMTGRLADQMLDRHASEGQIEVVSRLARYVPVRMCGDYFGFPGPNIPTMFRWSEATQTDMFKNLQNDPAIHAASVQAGQEMMAYLSRLLVRKRREIRKAKSPGGRARIAARHKDVFSRLVQTHFPAELNFDDHRLITNIAGLLIGGVETTSQSIVQVIEQLLRRSDVKEAAIAAAREESPDKFDGYVWEALRFNPINPLLFRFCEEDYVLAAGTPREALIRKGTLVFACTASAMFDANVFPDPETFNPNRPAHHRLHFGYGHHTCLGEHVGRMQIPEIVRRVMLRPNVRLLPPPDDTPDWQNTAFPQRFVVAYDAAPAERP